VDSDIVEFVVLGRFGAYLRSVLADLEIEDRPAQSVLVFREPDQLALLQLLATVIGEGREVQSVRCLSGCEDREDLQCARINRAPTAQEI